MRNFLKLSAHTLLEFAFLLSMTPSGTHAQNIGAQRQAAHISGATLHISTTKSTFYLGEVIPIELNFSSSSPHRYLLNLARYDRSGRMSHDKFNVTPDAGWTDSLRSYFNSFAGTLGGGLSNSAFLSETPTKINLQLNEWIQFTAPGKYAVTVESSRVGEHSTSTANPYGDHLSVTSDTLFLTIVPATPEWQRATLQQALKDLESSQPVTDPESPRLRGAKTLRYLGSPDAAREMARHLRGRENDPDFMFGLVASPEHEVARAEMRRLLSDPDFPVASMFVSTLAIVSLDPDEPYEVHRKNYDDAYKALRNDLVESLPKKRGDALPASLFTALNQVSPDDALPQGAPQRLAAQLVNVFDRLPVEKQSELLEYRWQSAGGAAWLPIVRKTAEHYEDFPMLTEWNAYTSLQLSAVAFRRWYELAPDEARPAIIREILRPKPRFNAATLGILPDKTLPEVEDALVEHFADIADDQSAYEFAGNLASLIHRYATFAVLPRMLAITDKNVGHWACMVQEPDLAYLLRADPIAARPRIEAGIAARGGDFNACNHSLLGQVSQLHFDSVLTSIALHAIDDDDPQVAGNAAAVLGRYGDASVEQTLWEHLTKWSAKWQGREHELQYDPGGPNPHLYEAGLGETLQQAIFSGTAWLAGKDTFEKLRPLSVDANMRQQLDNLVTSNPTSISFSTISTRRTLSRVSCRNSQPDRRFPGRLLLPRPAMRNSSLTSPRFFNPAT